MAPPKIRNKTGKNIFAAQDKYLIGEQPGMGVLISGILIALFIGLITRAFIAPSRVRAQIERAAASIHKDIQVQFDDAQVSLSDGIFPRLAVVITNVRMESSEACWMTPRMEVDEIRLPVSFWGLMRGEGPVREVQADNVKFILRSEYKDCQKNVASEDKSTGTGNKPTNENKSAGENISPPPQLVKLQASESKQAPNNSVRGVYLAHLEISYEKDPRYRAEFHDISFQMKNFEPRWIILNAKTHLFKDEQVGDYLSHANIHVEYKDSPEANVMAHFFGNWREGHYSVVGNYTLADKNIVLETELKHIPLSQVVALLQKYEMADSRINAKKLWLSFRSRFAGDVQKIAKSPMEVSDVEIDGDQIEMSVDRINFHSLDPLKYDPIRLDVQKLNIDKLVSFFNRNIPTKILAHLGNFSGQAEIRSDQDIHLLGNYSGLEFIFANKGQRELQTITRMTSEASYKQNHWKIHLSQIEPSQGTFLGEFQLEADKNFNDMDFKLKADEVVLSPSVQKLMTQGGEIGPVTSQLDARVRDGKMSAFKGFLKSPRMKIEGVQIDGARAQMDFVQNEVQLNLQIAELKMAPDSAAMRVVGRLFNTEGTPGRETSGKDTQNVSSIAGQVRTTDFKNLSWKNFSGQLPEGSKILSEGGWDEQGQLRGQVNIRGKKSQQKWLIQGTRAVPDFVLPNARR